MKKTHVILFALVAALVLASYGCGKASGDTTTKATTTASAAITTTAATKPEVKTDAPAKNDNVDPKVQAYVDQSQEAIAQMSGAIEGMTMQLSGRGSSVVFTYKYTTQVAKEVKAGLDAMESTLEANMQMALEEMKQLDIQNPSVIVEYLNNDGTMIATYEFK